MQGTEGSASARPSGVSAERSTRARVARLILEHGPVTAAALGERLGLTPAAVRRHLDALLAEGMAEARTATAARSARARATGQALRAHRRGPQRLRARLRRSRRRARCVSWPSAWARRPWRSSPGRRWPAWSTALRPRMSEVRRRPAGRASWPRRCRPTATPPRRARPASAASSCASTTARWRTWPRSSRSCARPRPRPSRAPRHPRPAPRDHRPRRRRVHHARQPPQDTRTGREGALDRLTGTRSGATAGHPRNDRHIEQGDRKVTVTDRPELEGLGNYKFGWADSDAAGATRQAWPVRGRRPQHLRAEERAGVDARPSAEGPARCSARSRCPPGAPTSAGSTSTTSSTSCAPRRSRPPPGTTCPPTSRTPTTSSASPRPRSSGWSPASPRSTSPRSSTTRSARTSRSRASSSSTPTPRCKEHPELFQEYFGTVIPVGDNKFAALNTAVWSGGSFIYVPPRRARRDPAAGLLPDQHREHGPVRADADHRRRGLLRPLRRGLHRADLLLRLAALARSWRSS